VQQVAALAILEKIALELETDVTAIAGVHSRTVTETGQPAHGLRITHEPLINRVHRVLIGEWTLELTQLDAQEVKLLPLYKVVHQTGTAAHRRGVAIDLALYLVVEVSQNATLNRATDKFYIKRVAVIPVLKCCLIGCHRKAAELGLAENRFFAIFLGAHR